MPVRGGGGGGVALDEVGSLIVHVRPRVETFSKL